jgi:hypothetical protein
MQSMPDARVESADVVATVYHTNGPDETHLEGDAYAVTDYWLLETLVGCGFVDLIGATLPPPVAATGATAGTPGTWEPPGSTPPATSADMSGITATPSTLWTTGQYVVCGDASESYWNGTAWAAGRAG